MTAITLNRTLVARHAAGRADAYDAALLDVAQDHLLWLLAQLGQFDDGTGLIFKGGTSLRKCRLGGAGRFSTDLDFAAPADDTVLDVCETIHGASISGFSFELAATRGDGRHWALTIRHPELGQPAIGASVEFARRPLILPCDRLEFVPVPVHAAMRSSSRPCRSSLRPKRAQKSWRATAGSRSSAIFMISRVSPSGRWTTPRYVAYGY